MPERYSEHRVCKHCRFVFLARASEVRAGRALYCSRSCASKANLGEKNPNWKGGRSQDNMYYKRRSIARHPEKNRVRQITHRAIKSGKLEKKPCEVCGAEKVEAHHEDYSKPLEVTWLCRKHHTERHNELNKQNGPLSNVG